MGVCVHMPIAHAHYGRGGRGFFWHGRVALELAFSCAHAHNGRVQGVALSGVSWVNYRDQQRALNCPRMFPQKYGKMYNL